MGTQSRPLAVVTGASSGIGLELAKYCAMNNFDLLIAADEPEIQEAARVLRSFDVNVLALEADLATEQGVDALYQAAEGRPVDALWPTPGAASGMPSSIRASNRCVESSTRMSQARSTYCNASGETCARVGVGAS